MKDQKEQPNFIIILCDQMRGDCLGVAGHPVIQTPNIDHLAGCGFYFKNAYSAVPSCLPARASLWTGQDQWSAGILGMGKKQGPIPNDYPHTLAGELADAGYHTHLSGKGHFNPQWTPMGFATRELDESGRAFMESNRFDEYREWFADNANNNVTPDDHGIFWNSWHAAPWHTDDYLHPTSWTMDSGLKFLKNRDKNKPFLLNISFARPHSPYVPPRHHFDKYMNLELPEPPVGDWADIYDNPNGKLDPNAWNGDMTADMTKRALAGYYGEISFIDQQIGRLFHYLWRFESGLLDNTWIIFLADHGDMLGDHHLWRKTYAFEGSCKIPFIVVPPKKMHAEPALDNLKDEVVELRDIMPTVLEAAGLPVPSTVTGNSVLPLLENDGSNWRTYLHGEHCTCYAKEQEMQYVTNGKRKFIWLPRIDKTLFFDLENDPQELKNLVDSPEYRDEIKIWRQYLVDELKARDCGWVENNQLKQPAEDDILVSPFKRN